MTENRQIARAICAIDALKKLKTISDAINGKNQKRKHRFWINPFLIKRSEYDLDCQLLKDIVWQDGKDHYNFCKMDVHKFEFIFSKVESKIKKCETAMRFPITARTRLAITLRFIATGDSYRSLEFAGQVSRKTISVFVPEVLQAIIGALQDEHFKMPSTPREWEVVTNDFSTTWQFPHALGVIDGKHIRIRSPSQSGKNCFNINGFYSIVLVAIIDARSHFMHVEVVTNCKGLSSDAMVFNNSKFYEALEAGMLNLPSDKALNGQTSATPFSFISDEVFGSDRHILNEYKRTDSLTDAQELYNQRLNRIRMTADIAFRKLVDRFRVFHRPLEVSNDTLEKIVKSCCILHNFLSDTYRYSHSSDDSVLFPDTVAPLPIQLLSNPKPLTEVRDNISRYLWYQLNTEEHV